MSNSELKQELAKYLKEKCAGLSYTTYSKDTKTINTVIIDKNLARDYILKLLSKDHDQSVNFNGNTYEYTVELKIKTEETKQKFYRYYNDDFKALKELDLVYVCISETNKKTEIVKYYKIREFKKGASFRTYYPKLKAEIDN